jgi:hypothetical protein
MVELNPMDLHYHMRKILLLERCPHNSCNELIAVDRFCSYASPFDDHTEACESSSHVNVVAVDRANDVRFFCAHSHAGTARFAGRCMSQLLS